jgi:hypothetical protein
VPERFGCAVARALAKDRADRWATAGAFVAELRAAVDETVAYGVRATAAPVDDAITAGPADVASPHATPAESFVERAPVQPVARERASASKAWVVAAAVVLVLAAAALSYWVWGGSRANLAAPVSAPGSPPASATAPPARAAVDALRYTIETQSRGGAVSRVSGRDAVGRVDGFRFVLTPAVAGRVAIVGPDARNVPTLYLPAGATTLEKDKSFTFPAGAWFRTTADTPSDTLTVVFLPEGSVTPAFAAGSAGRHLSVDEQRELARFVDEHRVAPRYADGADAALEAGEPGRPLAVDLTIRY